MRVLTKREEMWLRKFSGTVLFSFEELKPIFCELQKLGLLDIEFDGPYSQFTTFRSFCNMAVVGNISLGKVMQFTRKMHKIDFEMRPGAWDNWDEAVRNFTDDEE